MEVAPIVFVDTAAFFSQVKISGEDPVDLGELYEEANMNTDFMSGAGRGLAVRERLCRL